MLFSNLITSSIDIYKSNRENFYPYDRHYMYKLVDLDTVATYYEEQLKNNIKGEKCKYCIYDPICFGLYYLKVLTQ